MTVIGSIYNRIQKYINYFESSCLVLCYHRVGNDLNDKWGNSVTVDNFNEHMKFISKKYNILSMNEVHEIFESGKIPTGKSIVVTFDDGYELNGKYACEILDKYNIPATFYINTYTLGTSELFWWDDLQLIFSKRNNLPNKIKLKINNVDAVFSLGDPNSFEHSFNIIHRILKNQNSIVRKNILKSISAQISEDYEVINELKPITEAEIKLTSDHFLFSIGGHSHSHISLGLCSKDEQFEEINNNKIILEKIINKPIIHFSYPFGGQNDYNEETIKIVKKHKYSTAVTTLRHLLRSGNQPFNIPRFSMKNLNGYNFSNKIISYMWEN